MNNIEKVKNFLLKHKMPQRCIAKLTGYSDAHISNMLTGKQKVSKRLLLYIENFEMKNDND